jgi:TrmH family RNA methyltransferase
MSKILLKQLKSKKGRDENKKFIVEGATLVQEIPLEWRVYMFACSETYAENNDLLAFKNRADITVYRDSVFNGFSDTATPQGVLAVCEQKEYAMRELIKPGGFYLFGENISDPGNIGTLIRTGLASGLDGIVLSRGSGEIYNPKVIRASAGALFRVPVATDVKMIDVIHLCKSYNIPVYAAHAHGGVYPYSLDLKNNFAFLIGNETHGISDEARVLADALVHLPMPGNAESLNASVAGSVLLYEAVRQRLMV